ncbi:MAG: UDP-glucose/GDP-mannose dehydrogenase family protein [Planctomycetes bacterium]|nr:UDP-glucose/GDP-mannose dehydrogenase family protein [Planctomycetota bacterium]
MQISVIGSGYVGLVTGVCLADTGNHVVGVDIDARKVEDLSGGKSTIYEPGLTEMLQNNLRAGRLRFTTDLADGVRQAEVVFVAVGTPPKADGSADLTILKNVAVELAGALDHGAIVAVKSTVPVGTCDMLEELMQSAAGHDVTVVSNPEFLKEGSAIDDFLRPDRVVIGADDPEAAEIVRQLYLPYVRNQRPILIMSRRASEMTKYAANACLATRISFINEIANICDRLGIDVNEVRTGMGTDARIGFQFLYPGCGYGGSCFPKDVQAVASFARAVGYQAELLDSVHAVNERQKNVLFEKIAQRFDSRLKGLQVALWGVAFKPNTDDIREAPALVLIDRLLEAGAKLRVHDPRALSNVKALYGEKFVISDEAYAVVEGADALVVVTEWNEFRSPDFKRLAELLKQPIIFDGRNLYDSATMRRYGFEHYPIGRPATKSQD